MAYTIQNLKTDILGALFVKSLNQIANIDGVIQRATSYFLNEVDVREMKRIVSLASPVFDGVYDYTIPDDVKSNKIIDLAEYDRDYNDNFSQNFNRYFDRTKKTKGMNNFTIVENSGQKTLRINYLKSNQALTINNCDTLDGWTSSNSLSLDYVYKINSNGSLLSTSTSANTNLSFTLNTNNPVDISAQNNQNVIFVDVWIDKPQEITSIVLDIGQSNTEKYTMTTNSQFGNIAFKQGWNNLAFDITKSTQTGTPTQVISYLNINFNFINPPTGQNIRIDNIKSCLGKELFLSYYSKYLFKDITGVWKEKFTDDSDIINLDTDSYAIFSHLCISFAAEGKQGADAVSAQQNYFNKYQIGKLQYKQQYKSEIINSTQTWYKSAQYPYGFDITGNYN